MSFNYLFEDDSIENIDGEVTIYLEANSNQSFLKNTIDIVSQEQDNQRTILEIEEAVK